jgi:tRNA nucleotidyltransferase (CCA-adding enzyme)
MTVGALAHLLHEDAILDPYDGLGDWIGRRIVPVGDPAERIREHPVRWLRYFRRAHQWGFELDRRIRKVALDRDLIRGAPAEAIAAEIRLALAQCASPGRFLLELHEVGLLERIAPELALQFDGRPAGAVRHHPEVGQALHLILALEWIVEHTAHLDPRDRNRVAVAVLCHDLGKGYTASELWPAHPGHEAAGLEPLRALLQRLTGLTDARGRRLAEAVCSLHLVARGLDQLRAGSQAKLYDRHFRDQGFAVHLFALALGADSGGRSGRATEGEVVAARVEAEIERIRGRCDTALHPAWARALAAPSGEG